MFEEKIHALLGRIPQEVIVHAGMTHMDDRLASAVFVAAGATLGAIGPQDFEAHTAARARGAVLVDVGRVYDPIRGDFDHHQDTSLGCAAEIVCRWLGLDAAANSPAMVFATAKDLRGFPVAVTETGHKPSPAAGKAEADITSATLTPQFAKAIAGYLASMTGQETYEAMCLGIWAAAPEATKSEAAARAAAKAAAEAAALAATRVVEVDGLLVAVAPAGITAGALFKGTKAHLAVYPDPANPANTAVVKDTTRAEAAGIDLGRAAQAVGAKQVFLHNTGFIAVVAKPRDEIDLPFLVAGIRA